MSFPNAFAPDSPKPHGAQLVDPASLREAEDNPRQITDERFEDLKRSLRHDPEMMYARPIVVDASRGDVVCGNMRLRAAKALGWEKVPVYVRTFTDSERIEWMMRDNNGYGTWVPDEVASVVADYVNQGFDGTMLGFNDEEIAAAVRRATGEPIVPEPSAPPEPKLASAVVVEMRCTQEAFEQIAESLQDWEEIPGLEIAIVGG